MSAKRNLLIGVGVGAVLGVLFAPHKGSKTRKRLAQRGEDISTAWHKLKSTTNKLLSKPQSNIDDFSVDSIQSSDTPAYISSSMQEEWKS